MLSAIIIHYLWFMMMMVSLLVLLIYHYQNKKMLETLGNTSALMTEIFIMNTHNLTYTYTTQSRVYDYLHSAPTGGGDEWWRVRKAQQQEKPQPHKP